MRVAGCGIGVNDAFGRCDARAYSLAAEHTHEDYSSFGW